MDRVMWLATGAPNGQVRAIAALKLDRSWPRACSADAPPGEAEQAQHRLLAADIKRFLERPAEPSASCPRPTRPPGAPIGETPMDWLSPAPWQ